MRANTPQDFGANDSGVIPSSQAPTSQNPEATSVERVLNALDFEIGQITSEQQRPGWTMWAIYGGLASTLWFLCDLWEKGGVTPLKTLQVFLIFSVFVEIARQLPRLFPVSTRIDKVNRTERGPRFESLFKG